jgi:hypothetical protein
MSGAANLNQPAGHDDAAPDVKWRSQVRKKQSHRNPLYLKGFLDGDGLRNCLSN